MRSSNGRTHLLEAKQKELAELTAKSAALRAERAERETELQTLQIALTKAENRIAQLRRRSRRDEDPTRRHCFADRGAGRGNWPGHHRAR